MLWLIVLGWLVIGVGAVAVMHRRGHDVFAWAVPFLVLGPLAIPIAMSSDRHRPADPAPPLPPGNLDVLAFCDGSDDTLAALDTALTVLGDRPTSLTLAAVVDFEAATTVRGRETRQAAQNRLDAAARHLEPRAPCPVATVVIFGEPKRALQDYASQNGYELIVTGRDAFGRSWPGTSSHGVAAKSDHGVPVLVGPDRP